MMDTAARRTTLAPPHAGLFFDRDTGSFKPRERSLVSGVAGAAGPAFRTRATAIAIPCYSKPAGFTAYFSTTAGKRGRPRKSPKFARPCA